jgi:hypothetical protein
MGGATTSGRRRRGGVRRRRGRAAPPARRVSRPSFRLDDLAPRAGRPGHGTSSGALRPPPRVRELPRRCPPRRDHGAKSEHGDLHRLARAREVAARTSLLSTRRPISGHGGAGRRHGEVAGLRDERQTAARRGAAAARCAAGPRSEAGALDGLTAALAGRRLVLPVWPERSGIVHKEVGDAPFDGPDGTLGERAALGRRYGRRHDRAGRALLRRRAGGRVGHQPAGGL